MVYLGPLTDDYDGPPSQVDPDLLGCGCARCRRGQRCSAIQSAFDQRDRRLAIEALTDSDRSWLKGHGWNGR